MSLYSETGSRFVPDLDRQSLFLFFLLFVSADQWTAGRQRGVPAKHPAAKEEDAASDSWAAGHEAPPGGTAEPQPRPGEEAEEVSAQTLHTHTHISHSLATFFFFFLH